MLVYREGPRRPCAQSETPMARSTSTIALIALTAGLRACGSAQQGAAGGPPVNTGLANFGAGGHQPAPSKPVAAAPTPTPESALEKRAKESAVNLQDVLDQMEKDRLKAAEPRPA